MACQPAFSEEETVCVKRGPGDLSGVRGVIQKTTRGTGFSGQRSTPMSGEPFSGPTHVAFDPRNGDFYIGDGYSNAVVHKYSPDGKRLLTWGESGTGEGQFNIVHYIAVDRDGWWRVAGRFRPGAVAWR